MVCMVPVSASKKSQSTPYGGTVFLACLMYFLCQMAGFLLIIAATAELDCQSTDCLKAGARTNVMFVYSKMCRFFFATSCNIKFLSLCGRSGTGDATIAEQSAAADPARKWKVSNLQGRVVWIDSDLEVFPFLSRLRFCSIMKKNHYP